MAGRKPASAPGEARAICLLLTLFYLAGPIIIMVELLKPVYWIIPLLFFLPWFAEFRSFLFPRPGAASPDNKEAAKPAAAKFRLAASAAVFILGAAWIYLSGIGSFALCRYDYLKHGLIFAGLLAQHLPMTADPGDGSSAIIHYYFAYYILPVRIFQALHAVIQPLQLDHVVFLTYCLALFAALRVLASSHRVSAVRLLALLALYGGLDVVGHIVFGVAFTPIGRLPLIHRPIYLELDWWGDPLAPQSLTMNLFWAPQHFFAAFIGTALLSAIFRLERPTGARLMHAAVIVVASSLWSPYVAVGLAAVALGAIMGPCRHAAARWLRQGEWRKELSLRFCGAAAFPILLLAFAAVFYSAAAAATPPSLIFARVPVGDWLLGFVLRHGVAIFVLVVLATHRLVGFAQKEADGGAVVRDHLLWSFAFLLAADAVLLSLFQGTYDDWGMRTTLPVSILLAVALCRFLADWPGELARVGAIMLLTVSSLSSLNEMAQSIAAANHCEAYTTAAWRDLGSLFGQYEGRSDSLLYGRLVREP